MDYTPFSSLEAITKVVEESRLPKLDGRPIALGRPLETGGKEVWTWYHHLLRSDLLPNDDPTRFSWIMERPKVFSGLDQLEEPGGEDDEEESATASGTRESSRTGGQRRQQSSGKRATAKKLTSPPRKSTKSKGKRNAAGGKAQPRARDKGKGKQVDDDEEQEIIHINVDDDDEEDDDYDFDKLDGGSDQSDLDEERDEEENDEETLANIRETNAARTKAPPAPRHNSYNTRAGRRIDGPATQQDGPEEAPNPALMPKPPAKRLLPDLSSDEEVYQRSKKPSAPSKAATSASSDPPKKPTGKLKPKPKAKPSTGGGSSTASSFFQSQGRSLSTAATRRQDPIARVSSPPIEWFASAGIVSASRPVAGASQEQLDRGFRRLEFTHPDFATEFENSFRTKYDPVTVSSSPPFGPALIVYDRRGPR